MSQRVIINLSEDILQELLRFTKANKTTMTKEIQRALSIYLYLVKQVNLESKILVKDHHGTINELML